MKTLRTDMAIVQLPTMPPDFGGPIGMNKVVVDPDFGTKIVRVTDSATCSTQSLMTADSSQAGNWNQNDTMLIIHTPGGISYILQYDPAKMKATELPGRYSGKLFFSRTQPGILYQLLGTAVFKNTFKQIAGVWSSLGKELLCDFGPVLPSGFKVKWTGVFRCSHDDSTFSVSFSEGVQQSGFLCCVWRRGHGINKGFRILNTTTGHVTGDWGDIGDVQLSSDSFKFPFLLHDTSQCPNSDLVMVSPASAISHVLLWDTAHLTLREVYMTGHVACGIQHLFPAGVGGGQIAVYAYADTSKGKWVPLLQASALPAGQNPPQRFIGDTHAAFGKYDPNDRSVIWNSSDVGGAPGKPTGPFTAAWQNEIFGYDVARGVVYRACHTFNTGLNPVFDIANAIAIPSPTGKRVAFCSDMLNTLGKTPTGDPRGDVFIVDFAGMVP